MSCDKLRFCNITWELNWWFIFFMKLAEYITLIQENECKKVFEIVTHYDKECEKYH